MEIPDEKPLRFALQYINGIGRSRANQVLAELHLENKLAKDLTKRELVILGDEISKYMVGHELVNLQWLSFSNFLMPVHEFHICVPNRKVLCVCVAE